MVDKFLYRQSYDAKVRADGLCTELVDYLRLRTHSVTYARAGDENVGRLSAAAGWSSVA